MSSRPIEASDLVPAGVAALVVDPLEVVEVEEQQGERIVAVLRLGDQPGQLLLEGTVVAEPGQGVEQRGEPGTIVFLSEVIAGSLEPFRGREDRSRQDDHQERQGDADDDDPQEGDDRVDLALARLEVAEQCPEDDLGGEDDRERDHHTAADRCHPDVIGLERGYRRSSRARPRAVSTPMVSARRQCAGARVVVVAPRHHR